MANLDELIAIANNARGVGSEEGAAAPAEPASDPMAALEALRATTIEPDPIAAPDSSVGDYLGAGVGGIGQGLKSTFWDAPASILGYLGNLPGRMKEEIPPGASLSSTPILGPLMDAGQIMAHDFRTLSPEQRVGIAAQGALGAVAPAAGLAGKLGLGAGSGILNAIMGHDEGEGPTSMVQDFTSGATSLLAPLAVAEGIDAARGINSAKGVTEIQAATPGVLYRKRGLGNAGSRAESNLARKIIRPQNENLIFKEQLITPEEVKAAVEPIQKNALNELWKARVDDRKAAIIQARNDLLEAADSASKLPKTGMAGKANYDPKYVIKLDDDLVKGAFGDLETFHDPVTNKTFNLSAKTPLVDAKGKPTYVSREYGIRAANDLKTSINNEIKKLKGHNPSNPADKAAQATIKDRIAGLERLKNNIDDQISTRFAQVAQTERFLTDPLASEVLNSPIVKDFPYELEATSNYVPRAGESPSDYAGVLSSSPKDMYKSLNARYSALADLDIIKTRLDDEMGQVLAPKGPARITQPDLTKTGASASGTGTEILNKEAGSLLDKLLGFSRRAQNKQITQTLSVGGDQVSSLLDMQNYRLGVPPVAEVPVVSNFIRKMAGLPPSLFNMDPDGTLLQPEIKLLPPPPLRVEPDSKSVNENKDKIIEDLSMKLGPDAPQVISQLQPALDAKDPDQLGATMAALIHAYPEVRPMFSDDPTKPYVTFNKKVYTQKDKQMVAELIKNSNKSLTQKAKAMSALNENGTVLEPTLSRKEFDQLKKDYFDKNKEILSRLGKLSSSPMMSEIKDSFVRSLDSALLDQKKLYDSIMEADLSPEERWVDRASMGDSKQYIRAAQEQLEKRMKEY